MSRTLGAAIALACCALLVGCNDKIDPNAGTSGAPATSVAPPADVKPTAPKVAPFTGDIAAAQTSQLCTLDAINGQGATSAKFTATAGQAITFEGWAATGDLKAPSEVQVVLVGPTSLQIAGTPDQTRDDVAKAYSSNDLMHAGFKLAADANSIAAGTYQLYVAHAEGNATVACAANASLVVQ